MADVVIDSYETAQAHRDAANKPHVGSGKPNADEVETAEAAADAEKAVTPRATRKR